MNAQIATVTGEGQIKAGREARGESGLVAEAKRGSFSAFGELYERYRQLAYNTAYRILRQRQDAEDAVQRSFQRAFINLARFREDSTFGTWVTRIAINEALMMLRQRRPTVQLLKTVNDASEAPLAMALADEAP